MSIRRLFSAAFLLLFQLHPLAVAQTTTVQISGSVQNATPDVQHSATGSASISLNNTNPISRVHAIQMMIPYESTYTSWGSDIFANSVGSRSIFNNRGNIQVFQGSPFLTGTGIFTRGGGDLSLLHGNLLQGTLPGEFRFQAIDRFGVDNRIPSTTGSSQLTQGRLSMSGSLKFTPPVSGLAVYPPQYIPYKGDLIVEIFYGCDGIVDGGPDTTLSAFRQIDLDIVSSGTDGWAGPQGNYSVYIRAAGVAKTQPLGTGWPTVTSLTTSTAHVANLDTGLNTSTPINWGNGTIVTGPGRQQIQSWSKVNIPPIPVKLVRPTVFNFKGLTHGRHAAIKRAPGVIRFPATSTEVPATARRVGNGIEVRMRLVNLAPLYP